MKLLLLLFFCVLSQGLGVEKRNIEKSWVNDDFNLVGLQEDDKEVIYRPCNLRDLNCIRKFLASNSQCSIKNGPAPDPFILERNTLYLPLVNISVVFTDIQVSGLNNAEIKEFYVNKYTGNVVLSVSISGLSERSTYTSFRYHRTGKEPVVLTDFSTGTFPENIFTAVIPRIPNLELNKADIHADITSSVTFIVGPRSYNITDPDVVDAFIDLNANLPKVARESHVLKASLYMTTFIQHSLCDFGQKIITV